MTSKFIKDLNLILHYDSSVQYTFVDCPLKWANYYYIKIYTCTLWVIYSILNSSEDLYIENGKWWTHLNHLAHNWGLH